MKRYVAFLRGINVSGKNTIDMAELKVVFAALGFSDVVTLLNSGNAAFTSCTGDITAMSESIADAVKNRFLIDIPVFVIAQDALRDILAHSPEWWGTDDRAVYDNLIFMLAPHSCDEFLGKIGEPKKGLENVFAYDNAVFWSFSRAEYRKTNWWKKTASAGIAEKITIRTANTVRKAAYL